MFKKVLGAAAFAAAMSIAQPASAAVVTGFGGNELGPCDDCYPSPASLGFSANYFGNTYSSAYVSSNGYLTFGEGQSSFTPTGLGASYSGDPIIAAFFADLDRNFGDGSSVDYGTGTFNGKNAFGATWNDVGYYSNHTDKTNTFQVLLVDRGDVGSGDFDIYLNYDQILWETGDFNGGHNGFGGTSASAGYNAGTGAPGSYYQLPGSLVNGALIDGGPNALSSNSNYGTPGSYLFQVRNGQVSVPTGAVPEPSTWAMMLVGFGATGFAMRRRRPAATGAQFA